MNRIDAFHFAQFGGYYDAIEGATIVFAVMEKDCAARLGGEGGILHSIVERARLYLGRMAYKAKHGSTLANNRRKFMDAWYDYSAAAGLTFA